MNALALAVSALALVGFVSAPAAAVRIDRDFHESFDVAEGFHLSLHSGDGDVTVRPWDKNVVDVTVRYRADVVRVGLGEDPDFEAEFETGENSIRVIGRMTPSGPAVFESMRVYEYVYEIKAPSYVRLEIAGDDGDIEISGWRSDIECSLSDGDVLLEDVVNSRTRVSFDDGDVTGMGVSGELRLSGEDGDVCLSGCTLVNSKIVLEDGDIDVSNSDGDFDVSVDDGDVSLGLLSARFVRVRAADGDVDIGISGGEVEDVDVSTDDGDVTVSMPSGGSYSFLVTVDDGHVRVNVPERDGYESDDHMVSGKVRGGRGSLRVRTSDGSVRILES